MVRSLLGTPGQFPSAYETMYYRPGMQHDLDRVKWRRWIEYFLIAVCLMGAAALAIRVFQHTSHDVSLSSRLVLRAIILFLIAVVAGLDLLLPKGQSPGAR
jgi:hypothetical protein